MNTIPQNPRIRTEDAHGDEYTATNGAILSSIVCLLVFFAFAAFMLDKPKAAAELPIYLSNPDFAYVERAKVVKTLTANDEVLKFLEETTNE